MASIVGEMKEVPLFKLGELDAEAMRFLYELGTKNRSYTVQEIDGRMYVNTKAYNRNNRQDRDGYHKTN